MTKKRKPARRAVYLPGDLVQALEMLSAERCRDQPLEKVQLKEDLVLEFMQLGMESLEDKVTICTDLVRMALLHIKYDRQLRKIELDSITTK